MAQLVMPAKQGWMGDFTSFLMRGNVVDLAVAVVIGAAFTKIVNSLVGDLINPIVGLITGGVDFSNHFLTLAGKVEPTLEAAKKAGAVTLNYGVFVNALVNFMIVGFAIFWLVRTVQKLHAKPAPAAAAPTATEVLLAEIRDLLKEQHHNSAG